MLPSVNTTRRTWVTKTRIEVQETADCDGSVAVVPVGSVEQHGNHLPVGTDSLLAEAVSTAAADRADVPTLVTPVVWLGNSPHHVSLGGTVTSNPTGLLTQLEDVASSAFECGFDGILLCNGHGGNSAIVGTAVSAIGSANPGREVTGLTYFELAASLFDEIRESEPGGAAHAGEFETSLMAHLFPDLIGDNPSAEPLNDPYDHGMVDLVESGTVASYRPFEIFSESGAIGDPSLASPEKGSRLYDHVTNELATILEEVHNQAR